MVVPGSRRFGGSGSIPGGNRDKSRATVLPFILRGVTLYGIDSVMAPHAVRDAAWTRLGLDIDTAKLDALTSEIALAEAIAAGAAIVEGKLRGRVVVDVNR